MNKTNQRLSYVSGTSTLQLIGETIGTHFNRAVDRWGDREALVVRHQGIRWTYAELGKRVDALAVGLLGLGLAQLLASGWAMHSTMGQFPQLTLVHQ